MAGFFKSLFGGRKEAAQAAAAVEYQGYRIEPRPRNVANGWTTEAEISREVDGELRTHHFIRADTTGSQEGAVELTVAKAKTTIDQLGDKIFSAPRA